MSTTTYEMIRQYSAVLTYGAEPDIQSTPSILIPNRVYVEEAKRGADTMGRCYIFNTQEELVERAEEMMRNGEMYGGYDDIIGALLYIKETDILEVDDGHGGSKEYVCVGYNTVIIGGPTPEQIKLLELRHELLLSYA